MTPHFGPICVHQRLSAGHVRGSDVGGAPSAPTHPACPPPRARTCSCLRHVRTSSSFGGTRWSNPSLMVSTSLDQRLAEWHEPSFVKHRAAVLMSVCLGSRHSAPRASASAVPRTAVLPRPFDESTSRCPPMAANSHVPLFPWVSRAPAPTSARSGARRKPALTRSSHPLP
jgi:hypothetical protein